MKKASEIKAEIITHLYETEFTVLIFNSESYKFNTKIGICTCQKGKYGLFCVHEFAGYKH